MVVAMFGKFLRKLAPQGLFQGLDKRRVQLEMDLHRLYLLTSFHESDQDANGEVVAAIEARAAQLAFDERKVAVQGHVHRQVVTMLRSLQIITESGTNVEREVHLQVDPRGSTAESKSTDKPPQRRKRISGLSFAVGGTARLGEATPAGRPDKGASGLSMADVSIRLREKQGFSLELRPSEISHKDAGEGLFLAGRATAGTVVSIYPGVIYSPAQYKYMPGYPRVDRDNPYLMSRYDGAVIDGKPWGRGGEAQELWSGLETSDVEWFMEKLAVEDPSRANRPRSLLEVAVGPGAGRTAAAALLAATATPLERRNPLALAHFANHPAAGASPNVMICPYEFTYSPFDPNSLRPFLPNTLFGGGSQGGLQREGLLWVGEKQRLGSSGEGNAEQAAVATLVLVATRDIADEEIYLNYRLSPHIGLPSWYTPVNSDEDDRRWA